MTTKSNEQDMLAISQGCVAIAKKSGAKDASARAYRVRDVTLEWRDGKPERITESTTRGVTIGLYADGRYSSVSTSDLRPDALATFIEDSIALTKTLAADPFRGLPEPELYKGQSAADLQLEDARYPTITADTARKVAKEMEDAARSVKGAEAILSVTTAFTTNLVEQWMVTSNGFTGSSRSTSFYPSTYVSVKDSDGRRPEDGVFAGGRIFADLPKAADLGRLGAQRAVSRLGAKKGESAAMTLAIENSVSGRMISYLNQALTANSLQQKRSYFEGKLGQQVLSDKVTIVDDPLVPRGLGSRKYDMEGLAAKPRAVFENGVLRSFFVDTYYGRKLKMAPTSTSPSNYVWKLGDRNLAQLLAEMKEGVLVTGFIGGNSNSGTGDFSLGIEGFRVRNGAIAEPVAEMNISGNHLELWQKLAAIGNDPYPYSALRTPTLVFENVSVAGA